MYWCVDRYWKDGLLKTVFAHVYGDILAFEEFFPLRVFLSRYYIDIYDYLIYIFYYVKSIIF